MELIIGGAYQGKKEYAKQTYGLRAEEFANGADPAQMEQLLREPGKFRAVYQLHLLIRNCLKEGKEPEEEIRTLFRSCPGMIFITDEIGCGLVPADAFEREYRERTGRICCYLAGKACTVTRVVCGIGTRIKGESGLTAGGRN